MWFLGLLLLAASAGLAWGHRSQLRKLGLIASTEVCTVEHLRQLAASMAEGLGQGSLHFPAAVNGKVRCAEPLVSELAEVESVYYSMNVRREVEKPYESNRGNDRGTRRESEQLEHKRRMASFSIEDATGSIEVDPEGAEFTAEEAMSRFDPAGAGPQRLAVGRFALEVASPPADSPARTVGYRFEEQVIPVGREVFVLGEVTDPGGELRIESPRGEGKLTISVKSREQLLKELGSGSKFLKGAAIVFGILGLLLLIL